MSITEDQITDFKIYKNRLLKYSGVAKDVIIPVGVTDIDSRVFMDRSNIYSIEFSKELQYIGDLAFYDCSHLKSVELPESVTVIGKEAFAQCGNMTRLTLSSSLKEMGESAFEGCYLLKEVVIPEGLTRLEDRLFQLCSQLECITIPDSVLEIGVDTFAGCDQLTTICCTKGSIADYYFQMLKHGRVQFKYMRESKKPLVLEKFFI